MTDGGERSKRLISLDVFRGMTIAAMVLVNNPGTWSTIYGPLKHAEWHGITPTDYIFPFFLFIVGVAIPIALAKRLESGINREVYFKIISRSALIFALGVLMSAIPFFNFAETTIPFAVKLVCVLAYSTALFLYLWDKKRAALIVTAATACVVTVFWLSGYTVVPYNVATMRIPGVLQRIAVCYLIVSLIYLHTNWRQQAVIGAVLLVAYWLLMTLVPVPGCEITTIDDKACNLAAWLDRLILTESHIWRAGKVFDPEGILSTIPAIATTISGVLAGSWIMSEPPVSAGGQFDNKSEPPVLAGGQFDNKPEPPVLAGGQSGSNLSANWPAAHATGSEKAAGLFAAGTVLLAVGWAWSSLFPLNKSLWTSSYTIYTSGLALLTLGFCYYIIDVKGYVRWTKPFVIFGVNALALFVFSGILARIFAMIKIAAADGKELTLQQWIFTNAYLPLLDPINASLAYAVSYVGLWLFLMWLLYRRRIFIKV